MNEERFAVWVTGVFAVTAVLALGVPFVRGVAALVAALMFLGGAGVMAWSLLRAASRSRTDQIDIGGLFFFQSPRVLKLCFVAQIVVGIATAAARPNTGSALGVLAPVAGLALMGLWGARHGTFPPREA